MKKFYAASVLAVILVLGAFSVQAGNYTIGKTTLSGDVLELDNLTISAKGHASLTSAPGGGALKPGAMRLESLKAADIKVVLQKDSKGSMTPKQASATGGVVMKAKRADKEKDADGKDITVLRDVSATAKSAELPEGSSSITLTGNVTIKVTEPGAAEPLVMVTGDKVEVNMNNSKIRVIGQPGKPAGLTLTPKEEDKK